MVVFYLVSQDPQKIKTAYEEILKAGLAEQIFLDDAVSSFSLVDGNIKMASQLRLIFITKAMLFDDIEDLLSTKISGNDFRMYSTPVTQIDEATGKATREKLPDTIQNDGKPINPS